MRIRMRQERREDDIEGGRARIPGISLQKKFFIFVIDPISSGRAAK